MVPDGIGNWLRRRAVSSAGRPALVFRGRRTGYAELADRVDRLASALQGEGIERGHRVAYLGDNHPSFIEALFASALTGAIFVPLNTRLSAPELSYMLSDSGARLLIVTERLFSQAEAAVAGAPVRMIEVSDQETPGRDDYQAFLATGGTWRQPSPAVTLDDPALIVYTSGTTGRPKGAVLSHGNLTWNAVNVLADYDILSTDRSLMISPLFHVASLGMGCLPILLKGATVLLEERFSPAGALRSVEQFHATALSGVPTTFQLMMEDPAWNETDLSSLRMLTCGGSAVPDRVRDAFEGRGLSFSGGYGMTEAAPGITMLPPSFSVERKGSSGIAHFFTEFRLRDEGGHLHRLDARGEIETRGPNVFLGYWNNPGASAEAFTDDGWLRTGDVGSTDADGFLTIADRAKDMIISGGENIYSAEVEQAILALDGVTGAAVIAVPHPRWGEVPHAFVTVAAGATLDPEEMVTRLSTRLARYKVPRTLEIVHELPRTASGKVQKNLLRARYAARVADVGP